MIYQDDKGTETPFVEYVTTEKMNGKFSHEAQYRTINVKAKNYDSTRTILYQANNRYLDESSAGHPVVVSSVQQVIRIRLE